MMKKSVLLTLVIASIISSIPSRSIADLYHFNPDRVAIANSSSNRERKGAKFDASKISIGVLKLGANRAQIQKSLGKQLRQISRIKTNADSLCLQDKYQTILQYPQLELVLFGNAKNSGSLHSIKNSNPAYLTSEGIRVGDSIAKMQKLYAKYNSSQTQIEDRVFYGSIKGLESQDSKTTDRGTKTLSFKIDKDKVTEIRLDKDVCY